MPIRLLAVDMDGTLLTSERSPHPENVRAIHRAVEAGVTVVLASGRIRTSMIPFAEEMGLVGPMISCNGAYIEDEARQEIAYWPLPMSVFDTVWPYVLEVGAHMNVYTKTELIFLEETSFGLEYANRLKTIRPRVATIDEIHQMQISKALVMDHEHRVTEHRRILEERIDPALGRATVSEPDYLEFLYADISKGKALSVLCRHLGIDPSETAAIGDYLNDLEMIQTAGIGAAVENAHEGLKKAADVVVASNDAAGVAEFIDRYVLASRDQDQNVIDR